MFPAPLSANAELDLCREELDDHLPVPHGAHIAVGHETGRVQDVHSHGNQGLRLKLFFSFVVFDHQCPLSFSIFNSVTCLCHHIDGPSLQMRRTFLEPNISFNSPFASSSTRDFYFFWQVGKNNERDKRATRTDSRPAKRTIKFCFVTNMEKGPFVNVALT